ncbi:MAG: hypothetical protein V8Q67_09200 [Blautia massiliensis (ex Durand et al. 2017)]
MYFVRIIQDVSVNVTGSRSNTWLGKAERKGYIPTSKDGYVIRSGAVSMKAGRYYVSALVDIPAPEADGNFTDGIGIDLGLKILQLCQMELYIEISIKQHGSENLRNN